MEERHNASHGRGGERLRLGPVQRTRYQHRSCLLLSCAGRESSAAVRLRRRHLAARPPSRLELRKRCNRLAAGLPDPSHPAHRGSNSTINSVVGSTAVHDHVPLDWSTQAGLHLGAELPLNEAWTVRGGFSHANDPVPNATLTPLTAPIMQNALAAGAGFSRGRWHLDAAWQAQLPATRTVGDSGLEAGQYSNRRLRIWTQSLTLTARARFWQPGPSRISIARSIVGESATLS